MVYFYLKQKTPALCAQVCSEILLQEITVLPDDGTAQMHATDRDAKHIVIC